MEPPQNSASGCDFGKVSLIVATWETVLGPSEIQLPARFPVHEGIAYVDVSVSYEVAGSTRRQVEKLPVYIRELFRTDLDDFDKIF